ncbi:hypothetical protein PsorP6_005480 [Peronosclerospora sorghi]|uniref:Uncharacterized protein n=1 Tax=Peronosclerospora sorghi TaxID=230839 RepID=A0ACC0W3J7_9STRA|nr:hypothetical protein PsorP6_005480 [Peronosclerospora sorghi]
MSDNDAIPSEYRISEKWDKCIENFTLYFGAGLVAGGLTSLVLARSGTGRGLITGIGAGSGAGSSWTTCQMAFAGDDNAKAALDKSDKALSDLKKRIAGSN